MGYPAVHDRKIRKNFLAQLHLDNLKRFKEDRQQKELRLKHPHVFGGASEEVYKKRAVKLKHGDALDILTNQNLTRDTTILWHTQGIRVRKALRRGQLNPQALTSKAIKALGTYNKIRLNRKIKSRIVSELDFEKKTLVTLAQDRIEHLQTLERRLGHRLYPDTAPLFVQELLNDLETYIQKQVLSEEDQNFEFSSDWKGKFHQERLKSLKAANEENKKAAQALIKLVEENSKNLEWLQTTLSQEILLFLEGRIISTARQMQGLNEVLTYQRGSKAYLRGDLNNVAEDAIRVVRHHAQDFHNPVTHHHQLIYAPDKSVTIDSDAHTDGSRGQLDELMLVVSNLSGDNDLDQKGEVKKTSATKWRHFRSFYDGSSPYTPSIFTSLSHFKGFLLNIFLSPLNLLETAIRGNEAQLILKWGYTPPENENPVKNKKDYYALTYRIQQHTSISTKIGLELYKGFHYLLIEGLWNGLDDGLKQIKRLPEDLWVDFHNTEASTQTVLDELRLELKGIQEHEKKVLEPFVKELEEKQEVLEESPAEEKQDDPQAPMYFAQPLIPLTPYQSHGFLNSGVSGFTGFVDLFGHHMFAKHPFTAAASSVGAVFSFLAFFATPTAIKMLGKGYVKFLQDQGYLWTKDIYSASMAGAFTNFKLIAAIIEGIEHGPDSWFSRGTSHLLNDPAKAITYISLSWAIGYALVYLVNIPGLSEALRAHIGDPPQLSEIFGGFKVGAIGYHLLSTPQEEREAIRIEYIKQCLVNYHQSEKKRGRTVTAEKEAAVKACLESLVSPQAVEELRVTVQKAQEGPKQPQEMKLALMLQVANHKQRLSQLSPRLKAKLQYQLRNLAIFKEDATALDHYLNPEWYAPKSTLRSFLGRTISYVPTLFRCLLSPCAAMWTLSTVSLGRPWRDLGSMLWDDVTSTTHAVSRFVNKVVESTLNRLPRTLADIVVNSIVARAFSFWGVHELTMWGYRRSAQFDIAQEYLYTHTTGRVLNFLARNNTTPHPAASMQYVLDESMRGTFSPVSAPTDSPEGAAEEATSRPRSSFSK